MVKTSILKLKYIYNKIIENEKKGKATNLKSFEVDLGLLEKELVNSDVSKRISELKELSKTFNPSADLKLVSSSLIIFKNILREIIVKLEEVQSA